MADSPEIWLKQFAEYPLPILSDSQTYFLAQKEIPSVNISRLWKVIGKDPGLCLNFLRLAGKSKKTQVISVQHAMRMLGMPRALALPEELNLIEHSLDADIQAIVLGSYARAVHTSYQSLDWAQLLHESTIEDTATAALMAGITTYLISCYEPDKAKLIEHLRKSGDSSLDEATQQVMGFTRQELARQVAKSWSLPELVRHSFKNTGLDCHKNQLASLSRQLCEQAEQGWYSEKMDAITRDIASVLSKSHHYITHRIHRTAARCSRDLHGSYQTACSPAATLLHWHREAAPVSRVVRFSAKPSRSEILKSSLQKLRRGENQTYSTVMSLSLKAMTQGLGLSRVFFAVLDKQRKKLVIKFILTDENNSKLNMQSLVLDENPLFRSMMKKPASLWVRQSNAEKYISLLSAPCRGLISSKNFYMFSVFVKDKPIGLFYADRVDRKPLDENRYKYFKLVCRESTQAITRLSIETEHKDAVNQ